MTEIFQLLRDTASRLSAAGIDDAQVEAEIILSELLGVSRGAILSCRRNTIPLARLEEILRRRTAREPLQYILGEAHFMNLVLEVAPGVLIPRPETELLVEWICRNAPRDARICDVGTGSGAIALSVAYERPDVQVTALEISLEAFAVAERNRCRYSLNNVTIHISDLFAAATGHFDVIAANLPYVAESEYETLQPEVKNYEPKLALTSGADGLTLIRRMIAEVPDYLKTGGALIMELGAAQSKTVLPLLKRFEDCGIIKDYSGFDRHVFGRLKS